CLVPGIVLGKYLAPSLLVASGAVILSMGVLAFLFFTKRQVHPIVFALFAGLTTLCIGMFSVILWQPMNHPDHYTHHKHSGNQVWKVKILEVMKPTSFSDRYVARVKELENTTVSGKLIVDISRDSSGQLFTVDDELLIYGGIERVKSP